MSSIEKLAPLSSTDARVLPNAEPVHPNSNSKLLPATAIKVPSGDTRMVLTGLPLY
jgi:hypothetical protein